jgi:hypothetical protein
MRQTVEGLAVLVVLVAGCVPVDPLAGSPNRLQLTPTLRAACNGTGWSDVEILADLLATEADRLNELSYADERLIASTGCFGIGGDACIICVFAEIDQVYGR